MKEIFKGWFNYLLDEVGRLPKERKELSEKKLEFCSNCAISQKGYCSTKKHGRIATGKDKYKAIYGCGCPISKKVLSDSTCPRMYFGEEGIMVEDGYLEIEENLKFLQEG